MILTCPSCSAKFMIASEALGPEGREVRCGKCGHMWFQEGERDSLDELPPNEPQAIQEENIVIGFEQHRDVPEPTPEILRPKPVEDNNKPSLSKKDKMRTAASIVAALLLVGVLFGIFVAMKDTLAGSSPFLASVYNSMGFSLPQEEAKIAVDRLKVTKQGDKISASMYLINLTSDEVPVGKITAELADPANKIIKSIDIPVKEKSIKGESQSKVDFTFDNLPKEAVAVRVKISP